ncbi:MAG: organic hydroperoxide resistance protein [Rhodobacteraceae bacterium]|nr:organic hydroperoxide resistance protein [Paracoccaceae bacterium]
MGIIYKTSATATHEGRSGSARSHDGLLEVNLAMPKELGGMGGATNPEQLFACGYAACFTSALLLCARESKLKIGAPQVTVHTGLESAPDGKFQLFAGLDVALPDASREDAESVTRAAHGICPYSRATRNNLDVQVRLVAWKGSDGAPAAVLEAAGA